MVNTIMYMHAFCKKMADCTYVWLSMEGSSAGSLLLSSFRENPTVCDSIFRMNRCSRGEM